MAKASLARDAQLIYEIGCLRLMARQWTRFQLPAFANNSEHMFRVSWIALMIAKHEGGVDEGKLLKMALVHDLPESRTGDVDYVSRAYTQRNEPEAIADMMRGTVLETELVDLWLECEKKESIEAKIVKDADYIDCDAELAEQRARGNHDLFELFEPVREFVGSKLKTRSGRELWEAVRAEKPLDWIINSKTGLSAGEFRHPRTTR